MQNQDQDDNGDQSNVSTRLVTMSQATDSGLLQNVRTGSMILFNHPAIKHEWHVNLTQKAKFTIFAHLVFYKYSQHLNTGVPMEAKKLDSIGDNVTVYYFPTFGRAVVVADVDDFRVILNCWEYSSTDDATKLPFTEILAVNNRYKALYA